MEAALSKGADKAVLEETQARLRVGTIKDIVTRVSGRPVPSMK